MKFVYLMDPLEQVNVMKDTTFIFMIGAQRAGHEVYYLAQGGVSLMNGRVCFDVMQVEAQVNQDEPFKVLRKDVQLTDDEVDVVFIRTEPPFDGQYLMDTWLLDQLPERVVVVNSARGIRTVNEKVWTLGFPELIPPTLVTRRAGRYADFLKSHGTVIVKPTDGFGGAGVFRVSEGDSNRYVVFETLSLKGQREVIVQAFIPEAKKGDKRILLLGGEILSAVNRVQGGDDHRNNFFAGGHPEATEITDRDREVVEALRPHLLELGLHFVGIDMLGDYLIEVNVTSPTCVQECNRLDGEQYEDRVIEYVERLIAEHKAEC